MTSTQVELKLTKIEAARRLGVPISAIPTLIKAGKLRVAALPAGCRTVIYASSVDALLAELGEGTTGPSPSPEPGHAVEGESRG